MAADTCHDIAKARTRTGEMTGLEQWIATLPAGVCQVSGYAGAPKD